MLRILEIIIYTQFFILFFTITVSCIAARLENILLADEVSPAFIHQQITGVREQLKTAAKRLQELKSAEQHKVLQFFQSFGYDCGDMDILHHWSLHC